MQAKSPTPPPAEARPGATVIGALAGRALLAGQRGERPQAPPAAKGRGWPMFILLLIVFASTVAGIVDVLWGLEFGFLFPVALVALLIQWLLASIPSVPAPLAAALGGVLGVEYVVVRAGRLGDWIWVCWRAVFALLFAWLAWLWQTLGALLVWLSQWEWREKVGPVWEGAPQWLALPDGGPALRLWLGLWEYIGGLWAHGQHWLQGAARGAPTFDALGATLVWGLVIWWLASWAAWTTRRRHQALVGVLPAGVALLFVISYTRSFPAALALLLPCTLILMALGGYRAREIRWEARGIDFAQDLWGRLFLLVLPISLALALLGLLAPAAETNPIAEWLDELIYDRQKQTPMDLLADSLGVEQQPPALNPVPPPGLTEPGLPEMHTVQAGVELTNRIVMYMETSDFQPLPREDLMDFEPPAYRWRSYTYDVYTGRGWVTTATQEMTYAPGVSIVATETLTQHHRIMRQTTQRVGDRGNIVHAAGALVAVDQEYRVAWRPNEDFFGATVDAKTYRADILVPVFTELALRELEAPYPDWVLERYVQLPDAVPQRVRDLAQTLTADIPTPYDKAIALESHLRTYSYTLEVPAPPEGREVADYFLFDLQKGYCDYYATAMVVLARAAGLPARVVMGYIGGDFNPQLARFTVRELNSHAWVEIYFPEYGWLEFEPTAGRPAIARLAGYSEPGVGGWLPPTPLPPLTPLVAPEPAPPSQGFILWRGLGRALLLVGALLAALLLITGADAGLLLLLHRDAVALPTRLYHRLLRYARSLRVPLRPGDTPYELADALYQRLAVLYADRALLAGLLIPGEAEIRHVVETYVQAWYAPRPLDSAARRAVVWTWWKLQWRLAAARLWRNPRRKPAPRPASPAVRRGI